MTHDFIIRNGTIVDGSGRPPYRADLAIKGDRIVRIGRIDERAAKEIDAEGHVVTPGFIDGHTHMDAQLFWDHLGTNSCWNGVTSVVMGNCGFTLAPSRPNRHDLVISNIERAEDISRDAIAAGIDWTWESFPEYLDAVEAEPKAINYAAQIGHSALRTYVMGERAFSEEATEDDLDLMEHTLREALYAGAVGFSTSRSRHATMDGRPVAGPRIASWDEICRLVAVLGEVGAGVFELSIDAKKWEQGEESEIRAIVAEQLGSLKDLTVSTRVPITLGLHAKFPQEQFAIADAAAREGGQIFYQSRSRGNSAIYSFKSQMPYDSLPIWKEFRALSLDGQRQALRDPLVRRRLVDATDEAYASKTRTPIRANLPYPEKLVGYDELQVVCDGKQNQSVASLAAEWAIAPIDLIFDLAIESNFEQAFGRFYGWDDSELLEAMKHPRTVMTFSDSGAHVNTSAGAELHTYLLSTWVRERQAFTLEEAIRMMTLVPAMYWHLPDRGLLREGMIADINVFDPESVALRAPIIDSDLPGGGLRIKQKASGYLATIVGGMQTFAAGEHTGELPGRLLRGLLAGG